MRFVGVNFERSGLSPDSMGRKQEEYYQRKKAEEEEWEHEERKRIYHELKAENGGSEAQSPYVLSHRAGSTLGETDL